MTEKFQRILGQTRDLRHYDQRASLNEGRPVRKTAIHRLRADRKKRANKEARSSRRMARS